jgi:hypothetical protein
MPGEEDQISAPKLNSDDSKTDEIHTSLKEVEDITGRCFSSNTQDDVIRSVLQYELDVEILHKWREIVVIEEEIARGKKILALIEQLIVNEWVYGDGYYESPLALEAAVASTDAGQKSSGATLYLPGSAFFAGSDGRRRGLSAAASLPGTPVGANVPSSEPSPQYEIRADGAIIMMRCPSCGAERFRSMLGFLNHCRINCRLQFSSADDRQLRCGVVVDKESVPVEYFTKHPTLVRQELDLALIRADLSGPDPATMPPLDDLEKDQDNRIVSSVLSRFYISRPILVGNAAKRIAASRVESGDGEVLPTHRWRIYIRAPPGEESDCELYSWIKAVRFRLHPSYSPDDVVTLWEPPFEISRNGWGDFPVRVQILLRDQSRNPRPVELFHYLRVSGVASSKFVTSSEQIHMIDIDRRSDPNCAFSQNNVWPESDESHSNSNGFNAEFLKTKGLYEHQSYTSPVAQNERGPDEHSANAESSHGDVNRNDESQISRTRAQASADEQLLILVIDDFPLVGRRGRRSMATASLSKDYRPVYTREEFMRMTPVEQQALEKARASAVVTHISAAFPANPFAMDIDAVIKWTRDRGLVPHVVAENMDLLTRTLDSAPATVLYCRFCGTPHVPQDRFEVLQRNCSLRPRKVHVSSRSSATEIISAALNTELNSIGHNTSQVDESGPQSTKKRTKHGHDSNSEASEYIAAIPLPQPPDDSDPWIAQILAPIGPSLPYLTGSMLPLLSAAVRAFLGDIIPAALSEIPGIRDISVDGGSKLPPRAVLTPLHVFRAICEMEYFDFCSNAHMLGAPKTHNALSELSEKTSKFA